MMSRSNMSSHRELTHADDRRLENAVDCRMQKRAYLIAGFMFVALSALEAHPHMWVDGTIGLRFDSGGLSGIEVEWLFDEFSSSDMLLLYDAGRDGKLSSSDVELIRREGFEHLRNRDYFMLAYLGTREVGIPDAENFRASIRDGRLVYSFWVPLRVGFNELDGLVVAMFDSSYFVDFFSEPEQKRYSHRTRTIDLSPMLLKLGSEGWGTINVRAVQAQVS